LEDAIKEGQEFLDNNPEATKEEYEEKRKELEKICDPIVQQGMGKGGNQKGEDDIDEDDFDEGL